ncbi:uncharacterized protein LOC122246774 isoform X2 [Penaeus japonicus]|nr:uncharacterized protein LOC122246774 isoform X2 [Penaeus japonicus]XP_042861491.1 uncharacterized protein LOC122246774 isoform X2 [Penaeus japonicus]
MKANSSLFMTKPELLDVIYKGNAKLDTWLIKEADSREDKTSDSYVESASSIATILPEVTLNAPTQALLETDENTQVDTSVNHQVKGRSLQFSTESVPHHGGKENSSSIPSKEKEVEMQRQGKSRQKCKLMYLPAANTYSYKPDASCQGKNKLTKPDRKISNLDPGRHSLLFLNGGIDQNSEPTESFQKAGTCSNNVYITDKHSNQITENHDTDTDSITEVQNYSEGSRENHHTEDSCHIANKKNMDENVIFSQTEDDDLPVITEVVSIAAREKDKECANKDCREKIDVKQKGTKGVNRKRSHDCEQATFKSDCKSQAEAHSKKRKSAEIVQEQSNSHKCNKNEKAEKSRSIEPLEKNVRKSLSSNVEKTCSQVKKGSTVVPELSGCIENWQKVFPWVTYCHEKQTLICESCKWGSIDSDQFEVFVLSDPSKIYLTAKVLRSHNESQKHSEVVLKKQQIHKLFKHIYPILKSSMQEVSGLQSLTNIIANFNGGVFPGPQNSPEKEWMVSYMVKHIAICIQNRLLKSLRQSPCFSVLAFEKNSLAIIRWINQSGECEEHLLYLQRNAQTEELNVKQFMESKNIDLQKMSFYADIPHMKSPCLGDTHALPARLPSLEKCLSWLEDTCCFKDLFHYLETFTKLFKASQFMFTIFPEVQEVLQLEKPYSHGCMKSAKILQFFSKKLSKLKEIAHKIYEQTGSLEALAFSTLNMTDLSALEVAEEIFPRLHALFVKEEHDQSSLIEITELRRVIALKLKSVKSQESEEVKVFSILDIFLSYTLLGLLSYKEETVKFFKLRLNQVTTFTMEKVFDRFMKDLKGRSCELLQDIHAVRITLGKKKSCTVPEFFEAFGKRQDLCGAYPKLHEVYLKMKVLPFIDAKVELSMFDVALAFGALTGKFTKSLVMPMAYIFIEGPSSENIEDDIIREWSDKWKKSTKKKK